MKWKIKPWRIISTAMMRHGTRNIFTQPTVCPSVREVLFHPTATSHHTPGLPFLCTLPAHVVAYHRIQIIKGDPPGRARHVTKIQM